MNNFHNTTQEDEVTAANYSIKNKRQEDIILGYMQTAKTLTSSEVLLIAFADGYNWPITSPRRAMDTLSRKGFVFRAGKKKGPKGVNEFIWQLREEE